MTMKVICDTCKVEFNKLPKDIRRSKHNFCSKACFGKFFTGNKNPGFNENIALRECVVCKQKFRPVKGKKTVLCCSKVCAGIRRRNRSLIPCLICGVVVLRYPSNLYQSVYCSRKCASVGHSERMIGEGNPNYKHGNSQFPYPLVWSRRLRDDIRARDGNMCNICGKQYDAVGRKLHVHHIDWNKNNNSPNNLITLCHPCHRKCHTKKEESSKSILRVLKDIAIQRMSII